MKNTTTFTLVLLTTMLSLQAKFPLINGFPADPGSDDDLCFAHHIQTLRNNQKNSPNDSLVQSAETPEDTPHRELSDTELLETQEAIQDNIDRIQATEKLLRYNATKQIAEAENAKSMHTVFILTDCAFMIAFIASAGYDLYHEQFLKNNHSKIRNTGLAVISYLSGKLADNADKEYEQHLETAKELTTQANQAENHIQRLKEMLENTQNHSK